MIEAIIAGLVPAVMALVELQTGRKPSTEETTKALREALAAGLPSPTLDRAGLAAIAAGNARVTPTPPDRAQVDLADRLLAIAPLVALAPAERERVIDAMGQRLRESIARGIVRDDLGE